MQFTDSHCHLNFDEIASVWPEVRAAMTAAGVTRALSVCTTLEEFDAVHAFALQDAGIWASVGVHPDNEGVYEPSVQDLLTKAALPRVIAIGETGLDYYRLEGRSVAEMHWQRERFRTHIRAAQACTKPLIIHTRAASSDTLAILREEGEDIAHPVAGRSAAGGVFHCFTESMQVAKAALDMGYYISLSGIITFKNAADLRDVAAFVPLDRLLIETDSPYLAPVPYRGKTNTPALVSYVAAQIGAVKGIPVEQVAAQTSANFDALFKPN